MKINAPVKLNKNVQSILMSRSLTPEERGKTATELIWLTLLLDNDLTYLLRSLHD